MELIEAIKARKSIRGYKPDPVPKKVLEEILEVASRAPSSMNTQPWEMWVVAGDALDELRQANLDAITSGQRPEMEIHRGGYKDEYRDRQVAIAVQLFQLMDIGREDKEKRGAWMMRGFRFLDAPAAIFITTNPELGDAAQFDIGSISQTIALTALEHGLGTCIMGQGISFPSIVHRLTGIPESRQIAICLTIGYPDPDFPANRVASEREPLDKTTTWLGF